MQLTRNRWIREGFGGFEEDKEEEMFRQLSWLYRERLVERGSFRGVNLAISRLDFFRNFDFAIFLRNGFKHNKLRVLE